jgi:hypothetical protein
VRAEHENELIELIERELWQNQPELHRLKCADPFLEGIKGSTALQTV